MDKSRCDIGRTENKTVSKGLYNPEHRIFDARMESLLHCNSDCLILLDSPIQWSLGSRICQDYPQKQEKVYTSALVKIMRSPFVSRLIIGHK